MDVFTAIADPVRRDLVERLARGPARVADLAAGHAISRPAISRHLRVLGEAGLVTATDRGRERHYELTAGPLEQVVAWTAAVTSGPGRPSTRPPVAGHQLDALDLEVRRTVRQHADAPGAPHTKAPGTTTGESA